jgi:hypothetical protein
MGVFSRDDILISRRLDESGARRFSANAPLSTDYRNLMQTQSPVIIGNPLGRQGGETLLARLDPLPQVAADAPDLYIVRRLLRQNAVDRASRVAQAIRDPSMHQIAMALVGLANPPRQSAMNALWQGFAQAPNNPEASSALLLLNSQAVLQGTAAPHLLEKLHEDPVASAVIEGWRLSQLGNPRALKRLEPQLATVESRHPLFQAATRLRIDWRQASGERHNLQEAIALQEPLLATRVRPRELLQRAQLAVAAGEPSVALASLFELAAGLTRSTVKPENLARATMNTLEQLSSLMPDGKADYLQLQRKLTTLLKPSPKP